jgi:hypothetical protein
VQGGEGRGAPERCADGEATQTVSDDGVQRRRGSSGGRRRAWRGPAARGRPGVRRQRSIEGWSSSEGCSPEGGADGGDARTESDAEDELRWWKTNEVDAWAMGDECVVLGRGRMRPTTRGRGENFRSTGSSSILRGAAGRGAGGAGTAWRWSGRERGRGGPGCGMEQRGGVAST